MTKLTKKEARKADLENSTRKGLRIFVRTFGWPLVTVARDGAGDFKEDKCLGVKGLG